jgi:protein-tyrosine phosphatase
MGDDRFSTLHVCTGNIGRSPMAELLMRHELQRRPLDRVSAFAVSSAGTWGHEGSPMEEFAAQALVGLGVDPTSFRARELRPEHVAAADLVLTATREHRAAVVSLVPSAVRRTFTLKELARLVGRPGVVVLPAGAAGPRSDVAHAREVVARALTRRGDGASGDEVLTADDDVADPYGAPAVVYLQRLAEIRDAVARVVAALVPLP